MTSQSKPVYESMNRLNLLIHGFKKNPKKLFLADGVGAMLTAFLIIALLVPFNEWFKMPLKALYILATMATAFGIYSVCCYLLVGNNWKPYLLLIAFANLLYCFATIALVVYYYQTLTILAVIYFFSELMIMGCLLTIELMVGFTNKGI